MQAIIPMIAYEDAGAAMDWLCQAFGFEERDRYVQDGVVIHGALVREGGVVFCATPSPDYQGPKRHAETCEAARLWQEVPWVVDGVLVHVSDVDAHYEHAKAAGATMLSEIEDGGPGGRLYRAADPEGHRWMFAQAG